MGYLGEVFFILYYVGVRRLGLCVDGNVYNLGEDSVGWEGLFARLMR